MARVHAAFSVLFLALFAGPTIQPGWTQASTNPSSPSPVTAATVLSGASRAFSNGVPIHGVTLTGTANWIAGSDNESGNVTLVANADGSYQINLELGQSSRIETQTAFAQGQQCTWSGSDSVAHAVATHNCLLSVAWFMPGVALFGNQQPQGVTTVFAGNSASGQSPGLDLRQQQIAQSGSSADMATLFSHLTSIDIHYDPTTYLPISLSYNVHPDENAAQDIPVEVIFSNYHKVSGITVPYRIQRFVNGVLSLDITISGVSIS